VSVPAVAVNPTDVAPDATVTEAGTLKAVVLLESATAMPPEPAACESVTVHEDEAPEPKLVGLHVSWLTVVAATSDTLAVFELAFSVPVIPAVRLLGIVPAVAVKFADVVPAGTVTDAGTGSSLVVLERATAAPPADANWFRVAVHVVAAPLVSDVGLQERPLNVGNGTVTVPPVPVIVSGAPAPFEPDRLVIARVELTAEFDIVTLITATTPFSITESFSPDNWHVKVPDIGLQLMFLPAALALAPRVAVIDATLVAGYVSVHWSPAGSLPVGEVSDRFSGIVPPGAALPDANAMLS